LSNPGVCWGSPLRPPWFTNWANRMGTPLQYLELNSPGHVDGSARQAEVETLKFGDADERV
ncbi:MAG: hypothetical protein AAF639_27115, partial [Chloroflexota bacterium]